MILVTGGTGFLGAHLLYQLTKETEERIRATYRNTVKIATAKEVFSFYTEDSSLTDRIEWVEADITDITALEVAFTDITKVYHCAAMISFDPKDYHNMRNSNIKGTANVANLCISYGVEKLCYVSSIAAIEEGMNGEASTEETEWNPEKKKSGYAITKYGAELEVWRASQEGVPVVVVNPGVILGPGYWRKGTGSFYRRIDKGFPYFIKGETGFVGVYDVVRIMIELMNSDIKNEGFILVATSTSIGNIFAQIANSIDKPEPKKVLKKWQTAIAWRFEYLKNKLTGKAPKVTKNTATSAHSISKYDSSKVEKALGFQWESIGVTIERIAKIYLKKYPKNK